MQDARPDLAKNTLGVLSIVALILASFWILRPFLGATIWAAMVVVATWPAMLWIEARLWHRRSLAVAGDGADPAAPVRAAADDGHHHHRGQRRRRRRLAQVARSASGLPAAARLDRAAAATSGRSSSRPGTSCSPPGVAGLEAKVTPYARDVTAWLVAQAGVVGALTLQFLLTVVIAGVMYAQGEIGGAKARRFGRRLGGPRGEDAVRAGRPGDPRRGARRRRDGDRPGGDRRHRPGDRRRALRRAAHGGDVHPLHRPDRPDARAAAGDDLGLLERLDRLGRVPARVDARSSAPWTTSCARC